MTASSSKFESITLIQQLNGVPFDKFDLTNRDHHLSGNSVVHNMIIDSFVAVEGLVNSMKLELEERNSLLVSCSINSCFPFPLIQLYFPEIQAGSDSDHSIYIRQDPRHE